MKRPDRYDNIYNPEYMRQLEELPGNYDRDVERYIDYLEKELDFYRRGGAQILDKDKDE